MASNGNEVEQVSRWLFIIMIFAALSSSIIDFQATFYFDKNVVWGGVVLAVFVSLLIVTAKVVKLNFSGIIKSVICGFFTSYLLISMTIPAFYHYLTSVKTEIKLTVQNKHPLNNRTSCEPKITFKELSNPFKGAICIDKSLFEDIKIGQTIYVLGRQSKVGVSGISNFKLYRKNRK